MTTATHNAVSERISCSSISFDWRRLISSREDGYDGPLTEQDGSSEDAELPNAKTTPLSRYFGHEKFTTCLYAYDFGDGWMHDAQLNAVVDLPETFTRRLLGGEHAFPPDDCGGPGMYVRIRDALRTGRDPEGLLEWARETWGWTGQFDLEQTRRQFDKAVKPLRRRTR